MCDFQIDYRFFNSKSSTIKTKKNMKMKCDFKENMALWKLVSSSRTFFVEANVHAHVDV